MLQISVNIGEEVLLAMCMYAQVLLLMKYSDSGFVFGAFVLVACQKRRFFLVEMLKVCCPEGQLGLPDHADHPSQEVCCASSRNFGVLLV